MFPNKWITFFSIFLIVLSAIVWISSQNKATALEGCEEVSLPNDLIRIERFHNLSEKVDPEADNPNFNTGVPYPAYMCVAAGWNARYDVDEDAIKVNEVWTYTQGNPGSWWIHVALASDGRKPWKDENPDVDIVCFRNQAPYDIVKEDTVPAGRFFNDDLPD